MEFDRRRFLELGALAAAGGLLPAIGCNRRTDRPPAAASETAADYTLRIANGAIEVGPGRTISTTTFNGQFPGPLVRLTEGRPVTVDIRNDTDMPEQLHWHGQSAAGRRGRRRRRRDAVHSASRARRIVVYARSFRSALLSHARAGRPAT